ncbi:discoidin domain-containing protein [Desulfopila sp. IMCC35008]|uniref:fibronectin type III domain-containing protein n=1 Tax=Desulfopila sp. IMCC35008 TaxID=2653858 RepID=UPI002714B1C8|nr:discoidin domain-containing protein [Desulfopila sp. IMCC35008]
MKNVKLLITTSILLLTIGITGVIFKQETPPNSPTPPVTDAISQHNEKDSGETPSPGPVTARIDTKEKNKSSKIILHTNYQGTGKSVVDLTKTESTTSTAIQSFVDPKTLVSNPNGILLQRGGFDTSLGRVDIPASLLFDSSIAASGVPVRYLVQFSGPVQQQWKNSVETSGGRLGNYIPNNAFVVTMTEGTKDIIAQLPFIKWIDYYHPAYKIAKALFTSESQVLSKAHFDLPPRQTLKVDSLLAFSDPDVLSDEPEPIETDQEMIASLPEKVLLTVQTFENNKLPALYALIESTDVAVVLNSSDTRKSRVLIEVDSDGLQYITEYLAQSQDVEWIEPFVPPTLNNDTMHWVVQSNIVNSNPLWERGLTGAGQIVGVGDTGLDVDMAFFWDESQGIPAATVNQNQRKVLSYHDLAGNGDWDAHDHGTHVAGTIAGKSLGPNNSYNGVAYDAKLVIQDIGYGGSLTGIPYDLNTYFQQAYNDGARIHSNSWGSSVSGAYTSFSQDADEFMWNHKDFLVVFSAGNSGSAADTIGSPGTAKNVLTSGASENAHSGYNQEDVAYFSSNGPTDDGRIKPTVTAPGHYISSANSDGDITTFNYDIRTMSGTSMSAPTHAGSAALVRQYFTDGYYPSGTATTTDAKTPSAALVKATLVNSAVNMTGEYTDAPIPSTGQGWGRILLDNTLLFSGDSHTLFVDDNTTGLNTGEEYTYTFYASGSEPVKVTLAWTDYFPSLSSALQLVNDLDLTVTGPSGTFLGNVFSNGSSVTAGTNDRVNVVENVLITNPAEGVYTVTVKAYNIPTGPQPYGLVATGLQSGSSIGTVSFDQQFYQPSSTATVTVTDLDLDTTSGLDQATIHISSTNDIGQDIVLTETGANSGSFTGSFVISSIVQVAEGETLTVTYFDSDNGNGVAVNVTDTAQIDTSVPVINEILVTGISHKSAAISWNTSEQSTSTLFYRVKNETDWVEKLSTSQLTHSIQLDNLEAATSYEFWIRATDQAGNSTEDNNGGEYHTFFTDIVSTVWLDTAETGTTKFALTGGSNDAGENGLWHISSYYGWKSSPSAWYYGLESTHTYDTGFRNWGHITTVEPIDLQGLEKAELRFNHYLKTEKLSYYDTAKVQVSEDNVNFTTVYQSVYSATFWEKVKIDLSSYIDKSVYVRFYFDTQDALYNNYLGWIVDNIEVVTFIPDDGIAPVSPTGLSILDPGDNTLDLSWAANTENDLAGYNLYRNSNKLNTSLLTDNSYSDSDTVLGGDYSYQITAVDKSGKESTRSDTATATAGKPAPPSGITASSGNGEVLLSWNTNSETDLKGYKIYQIDNAASQEDVALISSGATASADVNSAMLIDGITTNNKNYAYGFFPTNMVVDLGKVYSLGAIGIHLWDGDGRFYRYTVAISTDGINYQQVIDRSSGQHSGYIEDTIDDVQGRYIKINGLYNSANAGFYVKEIKAFPVSPLKLIDSLITNTTYNVTGLNNGDEYQFVLRAFDSFGNTSHKSGIVVGIPDDGIAPVSPTGLSILDPGDNTLDLSWAANTENDLAGYNLYRNSNKLNTSLLTDNSYSDSDTVLGGDYSYQITAVDKSGKESTRSDTATATAGKPAPPSGITASSGNGEVLLSWNTNSETDLKGYKIYQIDNAASQEDVALISSGATASADVNSAMLIDGITTNNKNYAYGFFPTNMVVDLGKVYSLGAIGIHLWDGDGRFYRYTVAISTDGINYQQVIDRSSGQHSGYIEDTIDDVQGRYIKINGLYNSANAGFYVKEIKAFPVSPLKLIDSLITNTTYNVTGLNNGDEYQFVLRAFDSFGNTSHKSGIVVGIPDDGIAPVSPTGLSILDPGDNTLDLSWAANTENDLAGYNLYRNSNKLNTSLLTDNSYSDSDTVLGGDYSYQITAVDKSGKESTRSDTATATAGKPAPPSGITASSGNGEVLLSWNTNSETDLKGYKIYQIDNAASQEDVALISSGATASADVNSAMLIDGITTNNKNYAYGFFPTNMVVDLGKVYSLGAIGIHLWDGDGRFYRYTVAISTDGINYQQVIDRSSGQHSGYIEDTIDDVQGRYIKINGLYNSANAGFYVKEIKAFPVSPLKLIDSLITNTTYNVTGLNNGDEYQFVLRAFDSFGNTSHKSGIVVGIPDDGIAPVSPTGLSILDPGDNTLDLSWAANTENDLAGYNLYRNSNKLNTSLLTDNSYSDSDTVLGGDYSYQITAVDKSGKESTRSDTATATAGKPAPPSGITASSGNGEVLLSWNTNSETDLKGYKIYQIDNAASQEDVALISSGATASADVNSAMLIDGITTNNKNYAYGFFPTNMVVDLGKVYSLGAIGIHLWDGDGRFYRYTVAISTDGINYQQVIDRSSGQHSGYIEDTIDDVQGRYIKINGLYNSANAGFYVKEIKAFPVSPLKLIDSLITNTTYNVTGLNNGDEYQFVLRAFDSFGNTSHKSGIVVGIPDDGIAPVSPTGLSILDPGDNTLDLSWAANTENDLAGYNLYRNSNKLNTSLLTDNSYSDSDTVLGGDYSYQITAVDKSGKESTRSDTATATAGKPAPPSGITASSGNGEVLLSWNTNSETDLKGYKIYQIDNAASQEDVALISSGATASADVNSAMLIDGITTNNKNYAYGFFPTNMVVDLGKVYSLGAIGIHLWDGDGRFYRYTVAISTDGINYQQVIDRSSGQHSGYIEDTIDDVQGRYIKINGLYNSANAGFYVKEIKAFSINSVKLNDSLISNPTYNVSGLNNGQEYQFAVRAVDSFSNMSQESDIVVGVPDDGIAPAIPTSLSISDPGDNTLSLTWSPNSETDLAGYNVYRNSTLLNTTLPTDTSYADSDTVIGGDYSYQITAVDKSGKESALSDTVTATAGKPAPPNGIQVSSGNSEVLLSWNTNVETDLKGYNIYQVENNGIQEDIATMTSGANATADFYSATLIDGITTNNNSFAYGYVPTNMVVDLGKIYTLGSIGIHLWDGDGRFYRYTVAVSTDGIDYEQVVDRSSGQHKGYIEDTVAGVQGRFIKVTGLYNSANTRFHLKEITAFSINSVKLNDSLITNSTYNVSGLNNGQEYQFVVRAVDSFSNMSQESDIVVGIPDDGSEKIKSTAGIDTQQSIEKPLSLSSDTDETKTDNTISNDETGSLDPLFNHITLTLPENASQNRLELPAEIDRFLFTSEAGISGFGTHYKDQPAGLYYVWVDLTKDTPIQSWGEGTVLEITHSEDQLFSVLIEYNEGLFGWHAGIASTELLVGQRIEKGTMIGFGQTVESGTHETSAFGLIDLNRTDGRISEIGGVYVSPFDYLTDSAKQILVETYKLQVLDKYNPEDPSTITWGFTPYQPYLTNRLMLHEGNDDKLTGVWTLTDTSTSPVKPLNSTLTFIESETPIYKENVVFGFETDKTNSTEKTLDGTFEVNYQTNTMSIKDNDGTGYSCSFNIDESLSKIILLISCSQQTIAPESATVFQYELME